MTTFKDAQNKAQAQMDASTKEAELREITKDLGQAARDLATTNQNQLMQMQQQAQQSSMQAQSINNLSAAVSSTQGMGSRIAQAAQPVVNTAGTVASAGAGMLGSHLGNRAEQVRSKSMDFFHRYNTMNNRGAPGAQPGFLGLPNNGMGSSLFHGSGLSWNPASAQNYTFGAYQRAASYNMGTNAESYARAAMGGGLGMLSMENAGSLAGGMMGPAGIIASPVMGMMGRGMDLLNPLSYGIKQSGRAAAFGATSAPDAYQFLRGTGAGQSVGSLSLEQQARIGGGVQRLAQKDMMYSNEDIMGLQTDFAQTGQFLGVQNSEQYERRMKKLMDTHKSIMKTLQVTTKEATSMMDEMFSTVGIDHGQEMARMMTRMYSSAHLAGMSPQEMMQVGIQGAGMGRSAGLMSSTGTRMAMSARGLAGLSATNAMPTNLLATVGGEAGLGNLIAGQNMQFAGGVGGTLMALNGGNMGSNFNQALSNATNNLQGGGDIVNILANKHSMMDKFSPEMIQAQNANMLSSLAENMGQGMGSVQDRMKLLLQGRGMSAAQSDAYVKSLQELPEQMKREQLAQQQAISDQKKDAIAEQFSIRGRITYGFRDFMGETMGGNKVAERINVGAARFGENVESETQDFFDSISGADKRTRYTTEGAERIRKKLQKGEDAFGVGDIGSSDDRLRGKTSRKMRALQEMGGKGPWGGTFFGNSDKDNMNRTISEALESGSVNQLGNAVRALMSDQAIRGGSDIAFTSDTRDVANEEMLGALDAIKRSDVDYDKEKMDEMYEKLQKSTGNKNIFSMDREQRQSAAMEMFGGVTETDAIAKAVGAHSPIAGMAIGKVRSGGFGIKKDELEHAVGKEGFQEIVKDADRYFQVAKKIAKDAGGDVRVDNEKLRPIARRIERRFKKISDPKVKEIVRKTLRGKGIDISDDGSITPTEMLDRIKSGESGYTGEGALFQSKDGSNMQGLFDAIGTSKDREQGMLAIGAGFDMAMSDAGIDSTLMIDGETTGDEAVSEFKSQLAALSPEDIKKLEKGNQMQKDIALVAKQAQKGQTDGSYEKNVKQMLNVIGASGLDATAGSAYYDMSGKLDPEVINSSVTTDMAITTSNIQQTVKILDEITKRMELE